MDDCRGKRQRCGAHPESQESLRMQRDHLLNRQRGKKNFWVGSPRLDLTLPIGSLDDYLAPCGSLKVRPNPSWYSLPIVTTTTNTTIGSSSRQPDDSPDRKRARDVDEDEENNSHNTNKSNDNDGRGGGESDAMQVDEANEQSLTPKPDFNGDTVAAAAASSSQERVVAMTKTKMELFGPEKDSALHMAIRCHATEAALQLIGLGADVTHRNAKQVTPLILSCQKGNPHVVRALLAEGVPTSDTSLTGATALLQASHFGRHIIVNLLLEHGADPEQASNKDTTPLMRASQEGHVDVVQALLKYGAAVNRSNQDQMSAIMLASQRGHPQVVRVLARAHGEIDATTHQGWTPLMLACKRDHKEVVKILLAEGCELMQRDTRGRTAAEIAYRREDKDMLQILKPTVQVELMQYKYRTLRQHTMVEVWTLLQHERALVPLSEKHEALIHHVRRDSPHLSVMGTSRSALVRAMTLPAGLVQIIASFLPLPHCWEQRQRLILRRCRIDPDSAVDSALNLIDEVLEEGGFLDACDTAGLEPPLGFDSWVRVLFVCVCVYVQCVCVCVLLLLKV